MGILKATKNASAKGPEPRKIANKITENTKTKSLVSIAGGGDTVAAINKFKCSNGFTYLSTAGGAFLELLEGKALPGIKALEINEWNRKYCKANSGKR